MKRIAIYGGSFDPPHAGHAMIMAYIAQFCDFDEAWMMVSPANPLKDGRKFASASQRVEMCRLLTDSIPNAHTSDFELSQPSPSYTYLTLRRLKNKFPDYNFSLVIGSDNWNIFSKWRNHDEILNQFEIIIYPRPDFPVVGELPNNVGLLPNPPLALISSSFIRDAIAENKDISGFVPYKVAQYIKMKGLYEN